MPANEDRLSDIEERLARIEALVAPPAQARSTRPSSPTPDPPRPAPAAPVEPPKVTNAPAVALQQPRNRSTPVRFDTTTWTVTKILGWSGAIALVMAASYLVRLAIAGGWLTPQRQIMFAVIAGLVLITIGLMLRKSDREYASLLPAGGVVTLFISILGAHLYYELIGVNAAGLAVVTVCLGSLVLCSVFESEIYALFAVAGSYAAPFMLNADVTNIIDLVVYYSSWSVLFCAYAVWVKNRHVYLLALYLALVGFDMLWRASGSDAWIAVAGFQLAQFVIFVICSVWFAIRHRDPMSMQVAAMHAPALLIFYALEYAVLNEYVPELAPWIAVASAALLLVAYLIARKQIGESMAGSKMLLASYVALVMLHAGYIEALPSEWAPWVAPLLIAAAGLFLWTRRESELLSGPIGWVVGVIFVANYVRVITHFELRDVPASDLLLVVYALLLYIGYYLVRREPGISGLSNPLIYAGHVAAMASPLHYFDSTASVSLAWGALALICLTVSLQSKDKSLGQSSLLIFAISVIKVLAYDLSEAAPLVRIASLVVLGVSLYAGGWLYKKIDALEPPG